MKEHQSFVVLVFVAILFAIPLSAEGNAKIQLPDGLYMYDSSVRKLSDGRTWVGFKEFFVVKSNIIYSHKEAFKNFGPSKLNMLFTENKKYKILLVGDKAGEIYNVKIDEVGDWNYEERLLNENIKQGPIYFRESIYVGRLGSAARCIAVPEKYKETPNKLSKILSKEEVDRISKLAKSQLPELINNRKEIEQRIGDHIKGHSLKKERLEFLDKISDPKNDFYIGISKVLLRTAKGGLTSTEIVFCIKKEKMYCITSQNDQDTYEQSRMKICGMLDIDGCGENELMIEKVIEGMNEAITNLEFYKQKSCGSWIRIKKICHKIIL